MIYFTQLFGFLVSLLVSVREPTQATQPRQLHLTLPAATAEALQTALDNLPATGGVIFCPPGEYVVTQKSMVLSNKSNVMITGQGKVKWISQNPVKATFVLTGICRHIRLTGIDWDSRVASKAVVPNALLQTYEQAQIDGLEIDHCRFTTGNANQNAVGFRPYSAVKEQGIGRGSLLRGVSIHDCVFEKVGRMGVELTSHVHADGGTKVYYEQFSFTNNRGTNIGWVDGKNGMLLSLSGKGRHIRVDNNLIMDARYGGLEFVGCEDVIATNNRFYSTGATTYSAYAVSPAGSIRPSRIHISGGGGTVKGRPFILYGVDQFSVRGGNWTSENPTDIRGRNGILSGVRLTVTTGVEGGGGNALQLHECDNVVVSRCVLSLVSTTQTNYSVVDLGPAHSNTRCSLLNNILQRPAGGLDNAIHVEEGSNHQINGNTETGSSTNKF